MATDAKPLFYNVTSQPTTGQLPSGSFAAGYKVSYTTRSGSFGSLFVPEAEYTTDRVRDLLTAAATTIEEVAALKG